MLRGRFEEPGGRPFIAGRIVLPRLMVVGNASFLINTGADQTVLMPADAIRLGLDHTRLNATRESLGIGGRAEVHVERAAVAFAEESGALAIYDVELHFPRPTPDLIEMPSLPGRDILNRWRMHYNPAGVRKSLTFKVNSADQFSD